MNLAEILKQMQDEADYYHAQKMHEAAREIEIQLEQLKDAARKRQAAQAQMKGENNE